MAAGGYREFLAGETLDEDAINDYLMQGVLVFAGTAARGSAITAPVEGQFAFLKDTDQLTYYSGSAWEELAGGGASATGGSVTTITVSSLEYTVHTFTSGSNLVVSSPGYVQYLVVAGGGGGGYQTGSGSRGGGAGGAGGVLHGVTYLPAATYAITVGAGGNGGGSYGTSGTKGGNSSIGTAVIAEGGGFGAGDSATPGNGGSGGGGAFSASGGTANSTGAFASLLAQGAAAGGGNGGTTTRTGGAGGGATAVGANFTTFDNTAAGGAGFTSIINGTSYVYSKGGDARVGGNAAAVQDKYGDGANSSGDNGVNNAQPGIVIVRYPS